MTANIRAVSEDDFSALAWAANEAKRQGMTDRSRKLDVMARKANASLTNAKYAGLAAWCPNPRAIRWTEVPSTLATTRSAA